MKVLQEIKNNGARIRVQSRVDASEYITYSAVESITKEWDREKTWYYVLHHDNGETSTFNTKEWKVLRETFAEFM